MVDKPQNPSADATRSRLAELAVDRDADVPVGVQLGWTLCSLIADGTFGAGEQLPTLREMAQASGLNVNTIRVVYQRLEQKGLIESQQGSGTFVARTSPRGTAVGTIAASAAQAARETGVSPRAVAAALYVAPQSPTPSADDAADLSQIGQRQLLRRQIAAFESALAEIEAANPGVAPVPEPSGLGQGPALLGTSELEQVRTALVRRLAAVQAAIDVSDRANAEPPPPASPRKRPTKSAPQADVSPEPSAPAKRKRRARATARTLPAST